MLDVLCSPFGKQMPLRRVDAAVSRLDGRRGWLPERSVHTGVNMAVYGVVGSFSRRDFDSFYAKDVGSWFVLPRSVREGDKLFGGVLSLVLGFPLHWNWRAGHPVFHYLLVKNGNRLCVCLLVRTERHSWQIVSL